MSDTYLQHSITAIRHQMKALDEALGMLEEMLKQQLKESKEVPNGPQCPVCHSTKLSPMPLMGPDRQYFCEECDFKGQLNSL